MNRPTWNQIFIMLVGVILGLLANVAFGQPTAKITGPKDSLPGEMVVLSSTGSVGDNLRWIKPDGLQTLQVGCSLLDTQVVFATNKPGAYKFTLIVADKQAAIDYVEHTVVVGGSKPGPIPVPDPDTKPDPDQPTPTPNPAKWSGLQNISKAAADRLNDSTTRSKLKAAIAATVLDIESKCEAGNCPTVQTAMETVRRSIESVLVMRTGASAQVEWVMWRKGNQDELNRAGVVDLKDYLQAVKSIGSGL